MNLTENFSLDELTASQTATRLGIKNEPSPQALDNLRVTASNMEHVRKILLNKPIHISSAFRSPTLNRAIGGSPTSAHCFGYAVDFTCHSFGTPKEVCKAIMASSLKYDQMIFEGTWVHISFDQKMRGEDLTATFKNGKATYTKGIS